MANAKECEHMEVDDTRCYLGQMAADSILKDIDMCNTQKTGSAKAAILPCQSDTKSRKEMARLEKELCRQKSRGEVTIPEYAVRQQDKKLKLQEKQLQNPISDSFKYFLQCLSHLDQSNRKYFLLLYIRYVKLYSQTSRHHSISLKILISSS